MRRPFRLDENELMKIAKETVEENKGNFESAGVDEDCLFDVLKNNQYANGYELAKALDDDHGCEIDSLIVDMLDGVDMAVMRELDNKIKIWVKDNGIKPAHKIGETITGKHGYKEATGVIEKINHDTAHYVLRVEGQNGMPYIKFEDVKAVS